MPWPFTNPRIALRLRRWLAFSGMGAETVSVRSHMPWPWRFALLAIIAVMAILFGGRIYDEVRRITGWGGGATPQEAAELRQKIANLEDDIAKINKLNSANVLVDKASSQELLTQLANLQQENSRLKEDIAVFERLGKGVGQNEPLMLTKLKVSPESEKGMYRYEFYVSQRNDRRESEFKGNLQILVTLQSHGPAGGANIILLPRADDPDAASYALAFKYFEKVSGVFELPDGNLPRKVEFRLMQGKAVRATASVNL